jgi:hypothetical protein
MSSSFFVVASWECGVRERPRQHTLPPRKEDTDNTHAQHERNTNVPFEKVGMRIGAERLGQNTHTGSRGCCGSRAVVLYGRVPVCRRHRPTGNAHWRRKRARRRHDGKEEVIGLCLNSSDHRQAKPRATSRVYRLTPGRFFR